MEITLNLSLLKGRKNTDGTYPIQLQLHVQGDSPQRKTIYKCLEEDWDKKRSRIKSRSDNAAYANNFLSEEFSKYERKLLRILNGEINHQNFFEKKVDKVTLDDVFTFEMNRFRAEKKAGAYKRTESFKKEFLLFRSDRTNIETINLKWYEELSVFLANEIVRDGNVIKKKNIGSTAQGKVKSIRRMVARYSKKATPEDIKNFRINQTKPKKVKLTPAEVLAIESLELEPGSIMDAARDFFLMQIYLRGSRVGALVQAYSYQFENGRYEEHNQDGSKTNVGCKLISKAQKIVDKYYGKHDRLFPFYKFTPNAKVSEFENIRRSIKQKEVATSYINRYIKKIMKLAGIDKNISTHNARHTFARMALDKVSNPMLSMDLLGHKSLAVHQSYLNDIRKDDVLDAAADDIFG